MRTDPLSLYIHLPWCVRKCPYCDFNSHEIKGILPEQAYIAALFADLEQQLPEVVGRTVETVFIGGGTPSLFSPEAIHLLLEGVRHRLPLASAAEITLEANPGTVESARFEGFRQAGINRLSIGVQSFNEMHLKKLGRIHGREETVRAVEWAHHAGFENINLDLMFGLPGQTTAEAIADVQTAIALNPPHLSFYQLTLEPNTVFYKSPPDLPEGESIWEMQQTCQSFLAEQGFVQYEISAYARSGFRCRHNLNYWRFGDYLGIGAGAHGKITDAATGNIKRSRKIRHPQHYLEFAGLPERSGDQSSVSREELPFEFLMNHLRLREGFPEATFSERTGLSLDILEPMLSECLADGLLERQDLHIRCTARGWNFLDNVVQRFLP